LANHSRSVRIEKWLRHAQCPRLLSVQEGFQGRISDRISHHDRITLQISDVMISSCFRVNMLCYLPLRRLQVHILDHFHPALLPSPFPRSHTPWLRDFDESLGQLSIRDRKVGFHSDRPSSPIGDLFCHFESSIRYSSEWQVEQIRRESGQYTLPGLSSSRRY
jgi:hypothetical protein